MKYKDIEFMKSDTCCCNCGEELEGEDSPWVVSFDPMYKVNMWGGDTYEFRGHLCQKCVLKMANST